jgi:hypothetical protein
MMLTTSFYVVLGFSASALLLGWAYFRNYQLGRPSIGVINLADVAIMIGVIVLIPYLYLALPLWVVAAILTVAMVGILYFTAEPLLRARWATWVVTLLLLGSDIGTNLHFGATSTTFSLVNDTVLVLATVGVANLWAQSGMKARDVAVLGGALALYDLIATSLRPLMTDLIWRLATIPFAPVVTWGVGSDRLLIGLGDLLLATVFPLVMRKAFGRSAGIAAMIMNLGTIAGMLAFLVLAKAEMALPVMTGLGPLMVLQYVYWMRKRGAERTTWQYLQAEPLDRRRTAPLETKPS